MKQRYRQGLICGLGVLLLPSISMAVSFHPVVQANLLGTNGEDFMTVTKISDSGDTKDVTVGAGGMVYFAGGLTVANYLPVGKGSFQTEVMYGFQGASTTGGSDVVKFQRNSIQALQFYRFPFGKPTPVGNRELRVGGGVSYDINIMAECSITGPGCGTGKWEFKDVPGYIAQVDMIIPMNAKWADYLFVGGMYKKISYALKDGFSPMPSGNTKIDGSWLAFTTGVAF